VRGGSAFTKTFTGQILVANSASKFLAGGDSGSLMSGRDDESKAVGLLFRRQHLDRRREPDQLVLSFLGATMVGI